MFVDFKIDDDWSRKDQIPTSSLSIATFARSLASLTRGLFGEISLPSPKLLHVSSDNVRGRSTDAARQAHVESSFTLKLIGYRKVLNLISY